MPRGRRVFRERRKPRAPDYPVSIRFLGAAGNVTGSRFMLEANGLRVLVDCGLYQEREFASRNWDPFPVPPDTIDCVLLTHAHLDHSGYLPKLVREGFRGRIYCTAATAEITEIILRDSARIQEEDALYKKKRHEREGRRGPHPELPLYTVEDAERVFPLFTTVEYGEVVDLGDGAEAVFHDAGHILGSATIQVELGHRGDRRTVVFSGDLGRWKRVLLRDPEYYHHADYVVVESTYGDRLHPADMDPEDELADIINSTIQRGGNVVIPSFAVERAQEILYHLKRLMVSARIPRLPVYMDSPMATSVTGLFERHIDLLDDAAARQFRGGNSPLEFPGLIFTHTTEQSKAINSVNGSIIIAGAGMCNGGRIKHHLAANIGRPDSTVLFVGYQAHGTLGRVIVDGHDPVRILGQEHPVRARIVQMDQFSAHADRDDLVRWLGGLRNPPRGVFIVHGEEEAAEAFRAHLSQVTGWRVGVPEYGELVGL